MLKRVNTTEGGVLKMHKQSTHMKKPNLHNCFVTKKYTSKNHPKKAKIQKKSNEKITV